MKIILNLPYNNESQFVKSNSSRKISEFIKVIVKQNYFRLTLLFTSFLVVFATNTWGQVKQVFSYTGSNQTWVVPSGVTSATVKLWGAGGGGASNNGSGGSGGFVKGTLTVIPGSTLFIQVGGGGIKNSTTGGWPGGGGSGGNNGGSGGGYSGIFSSTAITQVNALAIAGGGGGAARCTGNSYGGAGGGISGGSSGVGGCNYGSTSTGGSQTAGGTSSGTRPGSAGIALQGGNGYTTSYYGGGGGGGYYGGAGGSQDGGGGGGSSYVGSLSCLTNTQGNINNSGGTATAPAIGESGYVTSIGNGGAVNTNGGNGLVIIEYLQTTAVETIPSTACSGQVSLSAQNPKPVAEYPFNGTLNDISGNGLNLSVTGGSVAYLDGGLYLNGGGGQQFSSATNAYLSGNQYYTIEFDMEQKTADYSFGKIFTWAPAGDRSPGIFHLNTGYGLHWRHDSDASPCCVVAGSNQGINYSTITLNQWYHVVGVRKGTQFTLYIDGAQVAQVNDLPAIGRNGSAPFVFGKFGSNNAPQGTVIKNFKIYNVAVEWYSGSCSGTFITSEMNNISVNPTTTTTYYLKTLNGCTTNSCDPIIVNRATYPAVPNTSASNPNLCAPNTTDLVARGMAPSDKVISFSTGSFSFVDIPNTASYNFVGTSSTVEMWVNPSSYTGQMVLFNKENQYEAALESGTGKLQWAYAVNPTPGWTWVTTNTIIPLNTWTHIAIVYDRAGGMIKSYVNGHLVHVNNCTPNVDIATSTSSFRIGNRSANSPFYGKIDNVRLWSTARAQNQIINNMYLEVPLGATPNLVANYPLNGNGNALMGTNGTLTNVSGTSWVDANYFTYTWSNGPQLPTASVNETQTTGSLTNANVGTHNYQVIATVGLCPGTASANVPVKVDAPSTLPTSLTADYNGVNNCWNRLIVLTETGGVLQGTSQYIYGTSSGGTDISSGTTTTSFTHTPNATSTNYYVGTTANGACPALNSTALLTYNLPTKGTALSGNESATCYLSGNQPIHFYNPTSNRYIGSVNPQGRTGILTMTSYTGGVGDNTMYSCTSPIAPQWRTAFMERSFTVIPTGTITGTGNLEVYFPFSATEFSNLQTKSTGTTTGNAADDVSTLIDLVVTKYSNPGSENGTPYDNCSGGTSSVIGQNDNGGTLNYGVSPAVTASYIRVPVSSFSEFYLHGQTDNSPLPITLTSFSGNCEKDGIHLSWVTATETNVNRFEVERSRNGQTWEVVATVNAVGNSSSANSYQAVDVNGLETLYYRLRSVDNDGKSQYFGPISVTCNSRESSWSIHPVPVLEKATITIHSTEQEDNTLLVMDINGQIVYAQNIALIQGVNLFELDLQKLSKGTYIVRLQKGNEDFKPLKFVKID